MSHSRVATAALAGGLPLTLATPATRRAGRPDSGTKVDVPRSGEIIRVRRPLLVDAMVVAAGGPPAGGYPTDPAERAPTITTLPSGSRTRATRSPQGWSAGSSRMGTPPARSRATAASQSSA